MSIFRSGIFALLGIFSISLAPLHSAEVIVENDGVLVAAQEFDALEIVKSRKNAKSTEGQHDLGQKLTFNAHFAVSATTGAGLVGTPFVAVGDDFAVVGTPIVINAPGQYTGSIVINNPFFANYQVGLLLEAADVTTDSATFVAAYAKIRSTRDGTGTLVGSAVSPTSAFVFALPSIAPGCKKAQFAIPFQYFKNL